MTDLFKTHNFCRWVVFFNCGICWTFSFLISYKTCLVFRSFIYHGVNVWHKYGEKIEEEIIQDIPLSDTKYIYNKRGIAVNTYHVLGLLA